MPALQNDTLIRALFRQPTAYTPVWLMRQAGRYLPEYNETRRRAGSFLALCKTPSLAAEVTLQPLERFPLDAAILFSDILTIPDAMGLGLYFAEGEGPRFERPLRDETSIAKLAAPDPAEDLRYVTDAIGEVRRALAGKVPLIGFCGSPYTLACYMVEGQASDDWLNVKLMLHERPALLHRVLETNTRAVAALLNAQIEAGVNVLMIFDTWGGSLSAASYREFSLEYIQRVLSQLKRNSGAARLGSSGSPRPDAIALAWIGASTSETRAGESAPTPRSRAISIPRCCSPRPKSSAARFRRRSSPSGEDPATCSILATAFRSSRLRKTWLLWSPQCENWARNLTDVREKRSPARGSRQT